MRRLWWEDGVLATRMLAFEGHKARTAPSPELPSRMRPHLIELAFSVRLPAVSSRLAAVDERLSPLWVAHAQTELLALLGAVTPLADRGGAGCIATEATARDVAQWRWRWRWCRCA